jgi:hypothetical protein
MSKMFISKMREAYLTLFACLSLTNAFLLVHRFSPKLGVFAGRQLY